MDSRGNDNRKRNKSTQNIPHRNKRRKTVHEHVSKGVIRRLARRGGVKRLSGLIYDEMRLMLRAYLKSLLRQSIIYCESSRRKTVRAEDVVRAIKSRGERLYGFDDPPFPITIRSTIRLTDTQSTVEESIPEQNENAEDDIENGEVLGRNNAATSSRLSENVDDSDATASDIETSVRVTSENDIGNIQLSENGISGNSEDLESTADNRDYFAKQREKFSNTDLKNAKITLERVPLDSSTHEVAGSSDDFESARKYNTRANEDKRKSSNVLERTPRYTQEHVTRSVSNRLHADVSGCASTSNANDPASTTPVRKTGLGERSRKTLPPRNTENGSKFPDAAKGNIDVPTINSIDSSDSEDLLDTLSKEKQKKNFSKSRRE